VSTAELAAPAEPRRRRRHGLLDATLAALLLFGVYSKTPCGALPVWAVRTYNGQPTPNLLATFTGRETAVEITAPDFERGLLASREFPPPLLEAANAAGADPELLVSYLAATGDKCEENDCVVAAPPRLGQALETYVVTPTAKLTDVAQGLAIYSKRLGSAELGLEALYVGETLVERAVAQAEASGLDAPRDVEVHSQFFSANTRRGPLQNALRVLALHRLRTLAWPADDKWRISSPYGWRVHPKLNKRKFHNGTDIATPTGTPLLSGHDGKIVRRGRDSVSGNWIKVDLGFAIESTYCHLSEIDVDKDQRVARKQVVGKAGATGRVTGPHLHYILRINDETVDAEMYGESPSRKRPEDGSAPKSATPSAATDKDAGPGP
jgi:murein DD-endopeptidase MepM/ murein hydrolase activator NlpD